MFKRRSKQPKTLRIDTLIGAGTQVVGDVHFKGGLHVDGAIQGNVVALPEVEATLSVSDSGLIEGSVQVPNVVLNGAVSGDIHASERVELGATAKVAGNVYYGLIEMAMGAQINGKLIHQSPGEAPKTGAAQTPTVAERQGGGVSGGVTLAPQTDV
jgi:cytoskeletal protein CcmA (bactofilin family)